jgi:hypothetical protein
VRLHDGAKLILTERLLTSLAQKASSRIRIELVGRNECRGHIQCDAIIMHGARVSSTPRISALDSRVLLIHEAAILDGFLG